jgi:hypothetical protein
MGQISEGNAFMKHEARSEKYIHRKQKPVNCHLSSVNVKFFEIAPSLHPSRHPEFNSSLDILERQNMYPNENCRWIT